MSDEKVDMQMGPMIDCIFQLLIFFMVTTTFARSESEIAIPLPGGYEEASSSQVFEEIVVKINNDGRIFVNEKEYDSAQIKELPELKELLTMLSELYSEQVIIIEANQDTVYDRVIDVINACAAAKITNILFTVPATEDVEK